MRVVAFAAVVLFILLVPAAHAAGFRADVLSVQDSIILGEQAAFDVRIANNEDFSDTFRFYYNDLFWDVLSDPLYHYFSGVDIRSGDSETVRLLLTPVEPLKYGQYKVDVTIKSGKGGASETIPLFVTVRPEKPLIQEYLAAVRRIVEIPPVVYPNRSIPVTVNLINRNPKNLTDLKVVFSSRLFYREVEAPLGPLESRVISEEFPLDPLTPAQKDVLNVKLLVGGRVLQPELNEPYEIGAYSDIVVNSSDVRRLFLKSVNRTVYVNRGNVPGSELIGVETNPFSKIFTKASPAPFEVSRGGKSFLAWELSLEPSGSFVITRTVSYRPLFFLALIIGLVVALYYLFRSPVYAIKKAGILALSESGISEVKIIVHVKNRSGKPFERLTITDSIPIIAEVTAGPDLGTVSPVSVYNDGRRTIVRWELDKLDAGEERILSYKLKSHLAIIGSLTLPSVVVRFYSQKGTKLVSRSSKLTVKV